SVYADPFRRQSVCRAHLRGGDSIVGIEDQHRVAKYFGVGTKRGRLVGEGHDPRVSQRPGQWDAKSLTGFDDRCGTESADVCRACGTDSRVDAMRATRAE